MEELNPASRFSIRDFLRPGCLLGIAGLIVIFGCIFKHAWTNHNVDLTANPEMISSGSSVKIMVWLVVGIGLTIFGALLSYVDYSRR